MCTFPPFPSPSLSHPLSNHHIVVAMAVLSALFFVAPIYFIITMTTKSKASLFADNWRIAFRKTQTASYFSGPSITGRLKFAIWRLPKIQGVICPRKCRLRNGRPPRELRGLRYAARPGINTSFLEAL